MAMSRVPTSPNPPATPPSDPVDTMNNAWETLTEQGEMATSPSTSTPQEAPQDTALMGGGQVDQTQMKTLSLIVAGQVVAEAEINDFDPFSPLDDEEDDLAPAIHPGRYTGRQLRAMRRAHRAMQLKIDGVSSEVIATKLGYNTVRGMQHAIKRLMDEWRDDADTLRELEIHKMERLQRVLWPMAEGGDLEAMDKYLKVSDRMAKLAGLDSPRKVQHLNADGSVSSEGPTIAKVENVNVFLQLVHEMNTANMPAARVTPKDPMKTIEGKVIDDGN